LAKEASDFRATTKMPNFRLNDDQIKAISATCGSRALTDPLPKHKPGNAAHGKELFETAAAWHVIPSAKATSSRRNLRRESHSRG